MNTILRYAIAAAVLASLAACGNKGPLIKPSQAAEQQAAEQAPAPQPAATPDDTVPPPADDTGTPDVPAPAPDPDAPPPVDDGGGNG